MQVMLPLVRAMQLLVLELLAKMVSKVLPRKCRLPTLCPKTAAQLTFCSALAQSTLS